nr:hypothetical protein [Desulfobacula sp.]
MTAAAFSFLGLVIGAVLQHYFSRHQEVLRSHRESRTKAYTDFLRCVCEHISPEKLSTLSKHDLDTRTADAKCRVCLYGSVPVISAFAEFERLGATINTPQQMEAFTSMVHFMRKDSAISAQAPSSDVQAILFGGKRSAT